MGFKKNGFLDRFLFAFPKDLKITPWIKETKQEAAMIDRPCCVWKEIIDKAVSLPFAEGIFNVLDLSDEAIDIFSMTGTMRILNVKTPLPMNG